MELRDYLKVMRNRIWLIVLSVVIVTLGTVVAGITQKPSYQGEALVLVSQQDTGITLLGTPQAQQSYTPGRDDVQTQVEVIQSPRIVAQVIRNLGLNQSVEGLMSAVMVSADTGTNNISIRVTDSSPAGAARIANTFAETYVTWSRESQSASIKAAADDVQRRLVDAQKQIAAIEDTASRPGASSADRVRLQVATSTYSTLADKLAQLRIAEQLATGMGSVLASATVDPVPVSPRPTRDAALGLAIGLLVGLLAAFLAEQLDTRVKSPEEAGAIYGVPILASVPEEKISKASLAKLTMTDRPGSPAAEAYRMLRNNLGFVNFDKGIKTVLITSAVPSEGKSTVAANLATVLSQDGSKVVLVVCDFHLPAAERYFELDYTFGLSNVLAGTKDIKATLQQPAGFSNLWVLPPGPLPPNPSELLGSSAMGSLLAGLRESADWVILDSAPVLAAADAAAVARWVDGALVVARLRVSNREAMRAGHAQLMNVGARILGLAVWGRMDTAASRGYYGYHDSAAR